MNDMVKLEYSNASVKVFQAIEDLPKKAINSALEELDAIGLDIRNNIMQKMRDTPKRSKEDYKGHHPSVPGNPPAIDTGRLVGSFEIHRHGGNLEVGTNVEYAKYLESGAHIKARRKKVLANREYGVIFGREVTIKPRPFLHTGLDGINVGKRIAAAIRRSML